MTVVDTAIETLEGLDKSSCANEAERARLQHALLMASRRIDSPWDVAEYHTWQHPNTLAALQILIDAGVWRKWVEAGGAPSTVQQLAQLVPVDAKLLHRLLRTVSGQGLLGLSDDGSVYSLTDYGIEMGSTNLASSYKFYHDVQGPMCGNLPSFLARKEYRNPTDGSDTNFQDLQGDSFFDWLVKHPDSMVAFDHTMTLFSGSKTSWVDLYPTDSIMSSAKPGVPLVVDIGGGVGHDLEKFRAKHPNCPPGSLVLQDLPNVIANAQLQAPIVAKSIDFREENPVKGARAYYLHVVLHDWSDREVVEILKRIITSMEPGYSKILLHEIVMLAKNTHPRGSSLDIGMMGHYSASEREETTWRSLAEQAGLTVTKLWKSPETIESIIELELP